MITLGDDSLLPHAQGDLGVAALRPVGRGGFSLIELLIVITVMMVLGGLMGPSIGSLLRGSNLTRGGDMVAGQLTQARQFAVTRNRPVEVRFYQYCSPMTPDEAGQTPDRGRFRALQTFEISESGVATPLGRIQQLPDEVCINSSGVLSSLLGGAGAGGVVSGTDLGMSIPQVGTAYNAVSFQFRPDGSINLDRNSRWFLTLHGTAIPGDASAPPPNFMTIQVNPHNGSIDTYRP